MKSFDETEWARTKSELREHLSAPSLHDVDSGNHRVAKEIEQQPPRATPKMVSLGWLAWSGAFSLLLATGLTALVLPRQAGGRGDLDFSSQVISVRAELPKLSVSEFQAPDKRSVVIWIEGADYLPAGAAVR
jgi:anti-sigma factor RsiW